MQLETLSQPDNNTSKHSKIYKQVNQTTKLEISLIMAKDTDPHRLRLSQKTLRNGILLSLD
jgi:hypothetical protein